MSTQAETAEQVVKILLGQRIPADIVNQMWEHF